MPLPYVGGKSKISKFITPQIPRDIETWVEPFGGMFWVFLNLPLNEFPFLKDIVYNDMNGLNYNLFMCLGEPEKLLQYLDRLPVQEKGKKTPEGMSELHSKFQKEIYEVTEFSIHPDFKLAAKYAFVLTQVFSGANPKKGKFIDLKGNYNSKFTSFKNKLKDPKWIEKFQKINWHFQADFGDIIREWDSPQTYFYVDPPYYIVGEGEYYSNHDFGRQDHRRLADSLSHIQGKFGLSYYDFDELKEWFPKDQYNWTEKEFKKAAGAKPGKKQTTSVEIFIKNY